MTRSDNSEGDSSSGRKTLETATTEEDQPIMTMEDEHNDNDDSNNNNNVYRRRRYVSRHRRELDHIVMDSAGQRRYSVPDSSSAGNRTTRQIQTGSSDENHHNHNGSQQQQQQDDDTDPGLCKKLHTAAKDELNNKTCDEWTEMLLPAWRWLKTYTWRATLPKDLIAGCTVGVMIVPQSMSYAKLAGLPVEYGLYSALMPVYAYAVFGSSRQLAVGPVALISLLLSTGLALVLEAEGHSPDDADYQALYNTLAVQTSFLVGIFNIAMGLVRLGFVTIFLSHAVISGFTTGAAVIIGMSQVKYLFGYEVERSDRIHEILHNIFKNIDQFSWKTFTMGTLSILALVGLKYVGKHCPKYKWVRAIGPLAVTATTIILTVAFSLDEKGIPIVGTIPKGLPAFTAKEWTPIENSSKLFVVVISIVIVGFMESIAIAKQLASKHKYEIDASQELIGLGMANFMGAMFQSYPVTGSFSRSAVNNESGAESGISGVVTATLVGITLLFLTPVFENMPLCVLAAIVISGVLGLLDYEEAIYLWKVHKFDFWVWNTACLGTMFLGVEIGLAIAVGVSLLIVIYESAYPHTMVLGRLPGTTIYRNIKQYPDTEQYDGIVLVRIDAPLYFANAQNVRDKIRKYRLAAAAELEDQNGEVKYIILEMSPVSHMDTSALHILDDMNDTYNSRGQQIIFANPNIRVMDRLVRSGFVDKVGRDRFFASAHDAVQYCLSEMDDEAVSAHESIHGRDSSDQEDLMVDDTPDTEQEPSANV